MSRYGTYDLKQGFIPGDDSPQQETPKHTNGDKIRSMTDEEMAQEIWSCHVFASFADLLDWLKQEVDNGD